MKPIRQTGGHQFVKKSPALGGGDVEGPGNRGKVRRLPLFHESPQAGVIRQIELSRIRHLILLVSLTSHWMISSARASSDAEIVKPKALAALRLMIKSNLVGCSTGRSAGLAPFKILST